MPAPYLTVQADFSGTPFGGTPTWTDITNWVEFAAGDNIEIDWCGRNDEQTDDATPGGFSFTVNTTPSSGLFTNRPGLLLDADVRVQVLAAYSSGATARVRADGYVDTVVPVDGSDESYSLLKVTCVDITARMGESKPLLSMLEHEMLADGVGYLYACGEPAGSTTAGNSSATARPAAVAMVSKKGGTFAFGGSPLVADEGRTCLTLDPGPDPDGDASAFLQLPSALTSAPFSIECVFSAQKTFDFSLLIGTYRRDNSYICVSLALDPISGNVGFGITDDTYPVNGAEGVDTGGTYYYLDGRPHHVIATLASDSKTMTLFVDGKTYSFVSPMTLALTKHVNGDMFAGGRQFIYTNGVLDPEALKGSIGMIGIYPNTALSQAAATRHYQAFLGHLGERSDQRYARVAAYGEVPTSSLPTGIASMGQQNLYGRTALEVLNEVARTEGSPSYATKAGALTFQARNRRYNATATLSLTAEQLENPALPRRDRLGLHNTRTVQRPTGAAQRAVDASSVTQRGTIDPGSTLDVAPVTDLDAYNNAKWKIATHLTSQVRIPELVLNLRVSEDQTFVESVLDADISTLIQVSNLPSQTPAGTTQSFFIEGAKETLGPEVWEMRFFSSPQPRNTDGTVMKTLRADSVAGTFTKLDNGLKIPF